MHPDLTDNLIELDLDVEQWRREIRVFAETTLAELQTVVESLSGELSPGRPNGRSIQVSYPAATAQSDAAAPIRSADRRESAGDDRLAAIRRQLAERIGEVGSPSANRPGATK